jgi:hypothetical protein
MESLDVEKMDILTFWSRQLAEHALFIRIGLEGALKELKDLDAEELIQQGNYLYEHWLEIFSSRLRGEEGLFTQEDLLHSLDTLKAYLLDVKSIAERIWLGFNYPSQIDHYLEELAYVQAYLIGTVSPQEELEFWLDIHQDHAALIARLLDPSEKEKFRQCLLYADIFTRLQERVSGKEVLLEDLTPIQGFNNLTMTLREEQAVGLLKSVIHPLLALHIYREGIYSLKSLEGLL